MIVCFQLATKFKQILQPETKQHTTGQSVSNPDMVRFRNPWASREIDFELPKAQGKQSRRTSKSFGILLHDPFVRTGFQHIEGKGAAVEDFVVEGAEIKLGAQFFLGAIAEFANFELTEFVAKGLGRPGDVPVGFGLNGGFVDGTRFPEVFDYLIASPTLRMDAGIDHESDRTEEFRREPAVVRHRILIKTNFFSELLGVERPTFDVRVET